MLLRRLLLAVHVVLTVCVAVLVFTAAPAAPWNVVLAAGAAAPLLAALPGLLADRRYSYQWLSIALVIYVSAAAMEVVAAGVRPVAAATLLAAVMALALVLVLVRRPV